MCCSICTVVTFYLNQPALPNAMLHNKSKAKLVQSCSSQTLFLQGTQVGNAVEFWGKLADFSLKQTHKHFLSPCLYNTDSVAMHVTLVQSIASKCTALCQMFTSVLMLVVNQIAVQDFLWSLNPPKHPASRPGLDRLLSV